ncbi:MAG: hypothetical protein KDD69_15420 [Bdellovibrionales bacterium]|nr:hypothetical protein [Bdellovibrionales bacterium]
MKRIQATSDDIWVERATTDGLADVSVRVPHPAVCVFEGTPGTGPQRLVEMTFQREVERRLGAALPRAKQGSRLPQFYAIGGLRPMLSVAALDAALSPSQTLGSLLGIYDLLLLSALRSSSVLCRQHDSEMMPGAPLLVATAAVATLSNTTVSEKLQVFVGLAPVTQREALNAEQSASLLLQWYERGIRKVFLGGRVVKLEELAGDSGAKRMLESLNADADCPHGLLGIFDSMSAKGLSIERLHESVTAAATLGGGIPTIVATAGRFQRRWATGDGLVCPQCPRPYPALEALVASNFAFDRRPKQRLPYRVLLGKRELVDLLQLNADSLLAVLDQLTLDQFSNERLSERLQQVSSLRLGRVPLVRPARALSSGERIQALAVAVANSAIESSVVVFNAPDAELHPADMRQLMQLWRGSRRIGVSTWVMAKSAAAYEAADYCVTFGQKDSAEANAVVFAGPFGKSHRTRRLPEARAPRAGASNRVLPLAGYRLRDQQGEKVSLPLGALVAVCGRVGSGKTRLLADLRSEVRRSQRAAKSARAISIGGNRSTGRKRRSDSTVLSALGLSQEIAALFARERRARLAGLSAAHFVIEEKMTRCAACAGRGVVAVALQGVGTVEQACDACFGARFAHPATLEVTFRDRTIADVLQLSIRNAASFFSDQPLVVRMLEDAVHAGLGQLALGTFVEELQTRSAALLKLLVALGHSAAERTVLLIDQVVADRETTEVEWLIRKMTEFCEAGGTVYLVTHDPECVPAADYVVEMQSPREINFFGPSERYSLDSLIDLGHC